MFVRHRHLVIEEPLPPPELEEFIAVEQTLGATLPATFREFLTVAHGGTVEFLLDVDGEEVNLGQVFRVGRDARGEYGPRTLLGELARHRVNPNLPHRVLPFAEGAGPFYLDLTPEGAGRVVVFLHALPEWAGAGRSEGYIEVAPSFEAFLEALYVDEDESTGNLRRALEQGRTDWIAANIEYLDMALPDWSDDYPELSTRARHAVTVGDRKNREA